MADEKKTSGILPATAVQPGDVLTIPNVGMVIVRDWSVQPARDDEHRIGHITLRVAVGRTDEGFFLTYPEFHEFDVYRSDGIVEAVSQ